MKGKSKKDEGTSSNHDKKKETRSVGQTIGTGLALPLGELGNCLRPPSGREAPKF